MNERAQILKLPSSAANSEFWHLLDEKSIINACGNIFTMSSKMAKQFAKDQTKTFEQHFHNICQDAIAAFKKGHPDATKAQVDQFAEKLFQRGYKHLVVFQALPMRPKSMINYNRNNQKNKVEQIKNKNLNQQSNINHNPIPLKNKNKNVIQFDTNNLLKPNAKKNGIPSKMNKNRNQSFAPFLFDDPYNLLTPNAKKNGIPLKMNRNRNQSNYIPFTNGQNKNNHIQSQNNLNNHNRANSRLPSTLPVSTINLNSNPFKFMPQSVTNDNFSQKLNKIIDESDDILSKKLNQNKQQKYRQSNKNSDFIEDNDSDCIVLNDVPKSNTNKKKSISNHQRNNKRLLSTMMEDVHIENNDNKVMLFDF